MFHGTRVYLDLRLKFISNNMVVEMTCGLARVSTGIIFVNLSITSHNNFFSLVLCFGSSTVLG